jgi:endonuclease/exonuclease/phosphatase (EEP) superfamily protein YafD
VAIINYTIGVDADTRDIDNKRAGNIKPRRQKANPAQLFLVLGVKSAVFAFQALTLLLCLPAFFEVHRKFDNLTLFYQYLLFAPFLISIGLSLFVRFFRPISILCALVIALVIGLPFARDYISNTPSSAPSNPVSLKVATYNIWGGNKDLLSFNTWLRTYQPDVIAIEEISPDQIFNTETLIDLYPYSTLSLNPKDVLIISRLPILAQKRILAPDGKREIIYVRLATPQGPVDVYALHAETVHSFDQWSRRNEYLSLAATVIDPNGPPTLVMGDFNASPWNRFYTGLVTTAKLHAQPRLFPPVTRLLGYRMGRPVGATIDHILTSEGNQLSGCRTAATMGSDHFPVICDLSLKATVN